MCCKRKRNSVLVVAAIIFVLMNSAVMADWSSASAFDFDGNGVIGLGDFAIFASHWGQIDPALLEPEIAWVSIMEAGFTGQMSAYETTNSQFAQYLNAALASGDIIVDGAVVKGANGLNGGEDFAGQNYYQLDGMGSNSSGATNGGASRINYFDGEFTVDSGFENHPLTYVSWYGATAFTAYYGWRLPTQGQWNAVADYDGTYIYGCGLVINNGIANYHGSLHPYGTTEVGAFGTYGYGMADMAGNVWELTGTISTVYRIMCGSRWDEFGSYCAIPSGTLTYPYYMNSTTGFRVCR